MRTVQMLLRLQKPIQWIGGKGKMVAKLMRHVPLGGRPYCEPYMGSASLFFARPPAPVEVLNDLDGDLVNLFRCLQDKEKFPELKHRLLYTLYSRAEFARALEILNDPSITDPVLRAWAFFVALNQSFGGRKPRSVGDWGRTFTTRKVGANVANRWRMRLSMLDDWHLRLLYAQIDCRDALEVIRYWDNPEAVFYVDPPYHPETRADRDAYSVEADHEHHVRLVETLLQCQGAVVLSGYDHPVYAPLTEAGWTVTRYETVCHAAGHTRESNLRGEGAAFAQVPRTEVVWANPRAVELINRTTPLFSNHSNGTATLPDADWEDDDDNLDF
jgi:DNA adenine methylase